MPKVQLKLDVDANSYNILGDEFPSTFNKLEFTLSSSSNVVIKAEDIGIGDLAES